MVLTMLTGCFTITPDTKAQQPTAYIDSISPSEASPGDMVSFEGHGTDPASNIVAYRWRSNVDGELSPKQSFETSSLSEGNHTIYFKVQNERGTWSEEVTGRVTVAGAPAATTAPVVSAFNADPASITAGGASTLSWTVNGAATVTIDQGIGDVALSGTRSVSPASNTVYTLKATNSAGTTTATAQIIVTPVPTPSTGLPDLIIEDISRSGSTITYTISNQGDADAGATISTLTIDGVVKANDPVTPLAAGDSREESFSYTYACAGTSDSIKVRADKDDVATESNEGNNELTETWTCILYIIPGPILTLVPDLVITDIWKVSEITGDKIYYKIKNQGLGNAPASTTSLKFYPAIDTLPNATDNVPEIPAGQELTRKFASYNWGGGGTNCTVKADYNDAVGETNETNNSRTELTSGF